MLFTGTLEVSHNCVCRGVRLYDDVTVNVTVIKRNAIKREKFPRLPKSLIFWGYSVKRNLINAFL